MQQKERVGIFYLSISKLWFFFIFVSLDSISSWELHLENWILHFRLIKHYLLCLPMVLINIYFDNWCDFELLLYSFLECMFCTLNRILKQENKWFSWRMSISTVSDYSEPIILTKHEELSDNWTSKKKLFFFPQGCTLIKHCNAQRSDSSVWGSVRKYFDL